MPAAGCGARTFDPRLFDVASGVRDLLGQIQDVVAGMSGGPGAAKGGGPRGGSSSRPEGHGSWPGGFGGPWGRGWPGSPGKPGTPGSPRGPKAGRGDVRAAILALLREGPRTGYQIMSEIEERSSGVWRPSPGAVYPALSLLADEGLISGAESDGRRTFSLTDAGRSYIEENPGMARGTWESMGQQGPCDVPALFAHAAKLGGGIVQMARAGTPEQIQAAERLLEQTRRTLYRILADDMGGEASEGGVDLDDDDAQDE
jgi:DNA-binding PadR family transcriptional regulator